MSKHAEIRALLEQGLDKTEIGRRLGMSRHAVRRALAGPGGHARSEADVAALVEAARKGGTIEELCDALDVAPKKLRDLILSARREGFTVDVAGTWVGRRPAAEASGERVIQASGKSTAIACLGDVHIGSKHHLRAEFHDFVHKAYDRGVRVMFSAGDILDGVYRHSRWEQDRHGLEEQAAEAAEAFPQLPGLTYWGIAGNHDETFERDSGMSVCRALEDAFRRVGRKDLTMLGSRGATARIVRPGESRGLVVELWHPLKGPAYALSYKLQKKIEGYAVGQKPDVLFAGHWHQHCYVAVRGVHAFSAGCFQGGGSSFGKALGGSPAMGSWIVEYALTPDGTVRHLKPEWLAYYEHERPRDIVA